jgi:hypothetical protein
MFFSCLLLFGRSKRSKVAVKGERPTMKVKSGANKRKLTKNRCSITKGERPTKNQYGVTTQTGARRAPYERRFGFSRSKLKPPAIQVTPKAQIQISTNRRGLLAGAKVN